MRIEDKKERKEREKERDRGEEERGERVRKGKPHMMVRGSDDDVIIKIYPQGSLIAGVPQYIQVFRLFFYLFI